MTEAKATAKMDLGGHDVGYEWEAGSTRPSDPQPGKWVVKLTQAGWKVVYRPLSAAASSNVVQAEAPVGASIMNGPEYPIYEFPPTDGGEVAAKTMALKLVDIARGRL